MLIATLEDEPVLSGEEDLAVLHLLGWWQCLNQTRRWRLCYRELHHVLNLRGWMIGFSRWLELVLFLSESAWRAQQFTASAVVEAVAQAPQPVQANGKVKAEMGDPAMEEVALWEIAPGGDSFVSFSFLPKFQQKSSFLYLWVPKGHGELWMGQTWITLILLCHQHAALGGSRSLSKALIMEPLPNRGTR